MFRPAQGAAIGIAYVLPIEFRTDADTLARGSLALIVEYACQENPAGVFDYFRQRFL
jgi:hypothetical protein